jgi:predicted flavoprotein YhiN
LKNTLNRLIPSALVSPILEVANVNGETANHSVRREDRIKLVSLMKAIPLNVKGLLGADKAVVSSGGVAPEEVNFKIMQSRLVPNLYIIGDVLNIDRPSGGYSLQLCWTTGFVAGSSS